MIVRGGHQTGGLTPGDECPTTTTITAITSYYLCSYATAYRGTYFASLVSDGDSLNSRPIPLLKLGML